MVRVIMSTGKYDYVLKSQLFRLMKEGRIKAVLSTNGDVTIV